MGISTRGSRLHVAVLALGTILFFLAYAAKLHLIQKAAYFSDSYVALQMARSWVDPGVFLWETTWGWMSAVHNNYILALFAPLTSHRFGLGMGIEAFVIVQLALTLLAYLLAGRLLHANSAPLPILRWTALCLGPIAIWMLDFPTYGWDPELLYAPLGCLLALALIAKRRGCVVLASLLVCMVKEDGPILAWAIHSAYLLSEGQRLTPALWKDLAKNTALWIAVFGVGMAILYVNKALLPASEITQTHAQYFKDIPRLLTDPAPRGLAIHHIGLQLLLLASGLVLVAPDRLRFAVRDFFLVYPPVLTVCMVASIGKFIHPVAQFDGLNWPPRFVLPWTLVAAVFLFQQRRAATPQRHGLAPLALASAIAICVPTQVLGPAQRYSFSERLRWLEMPAFKHWPTNPAETRFLSCLESTLPDSVSLKLSPPLFELFKSRAPYLLGRPPHPGEELDLLIRSALHAAWGDTPRGTKERFKCAPMTPVSFERLTIYACPPVFENVRACAI